MSKVSDRLQGLNVSRTFSVTLEYKPSDPDNPMDLVSYLMVDPLAEYTNTRRTIPGDVIVTIMNQLFHGSGTVKFNTQHDMPSIEGNSYGVNLPDQKARFVTIEIFGNSVILRTSIFSSVHDIDELVNSYFDVWIAWPSYHLVDVYLKVIDSYCKYNDDSVIETNSVFYEDASFDLECRNPNPSIETKVIDIVGKFAPYDSGLRW